MSFYHLNPNRRGERIARRLEALGDYRVLRRLPQPDEIWCRSMPVSENALKIGIIDCETSGLDAERHKMIELAAGTLTIDLEVGDVVDVEAPKSWLEDPGQDLPIEIERLTHITSNMLAGRSFPEEEIMQLLKGVDIFTAHNARFDRSFVTRRFPALAEMPWTCSMTEIDWPSLGWSGGRSIAGLLTQAGFFLPDAHRAAADVWATTCLLASNTGEGKSLASHMVDRAQRITHRLFAISAPYEFKDMLKAAGYRWSVERRAWWIEGDPERIANEAAWLKEIAGAIRPTVDEISWVNRFE